MKGRARPTNGLITVEQFYRLVPDGQKADLIDGVVHMASPDKPATSTQMTHAVVRWCHVSTTIPVANNPPTRTGNRVGNSHAVTAIRSPTPNSVVPEPSRRRSAIMAVTVRRDAEQMAKEIFTDRADPNS